MNIRKWRLLLCLAAALCLMAGCAAQQPKEITDGEYTCAIALEGGTGKATVSSPARVTVNGGRAELEVVWSSPWYDYMLIDGQRYDPISTSGNSVFLIPVDLHTDSIAIEADTVAMSTPHLISYTLKLDLSSLTAVREEK